MGFFFTFAKVIKPNQLPMLEHIQNLSEKEKDLIIHSPMYVSLLIAGADGEIHDAEKHRMLQLIHTKTFSEKYDLRELYKTLDHDAEHELRKIVATLPSDKKERTEMLTGILSGLNSILPKLEHQFQVHLYKSLKQFAHYISHAEGGFWKVGAVNHLQQELMKLPMIKDPSHETA